jgi:Flp pilus assembly protein TadG
MQIKNVQHQRGTVVVTVAMTLPILLIAMGWALDFGHVFVIKTRLQNALDATALSAAIAINADVTHNVAAATAKGIATFNLFIATTGNNELKDLNAESLVFDYSKTLYPWGTFNQATDNFAFVRVTSTNMLNVTPILIKISEQFKNNIPVPAIATAGPVGSNCQIMPFLLCADMVSPLDTNCNDGACYGYNVGQVYDLNQACTGKNCQPQQLSHGNYGLLNLPGSQGGNDIRLALEGKSINVCPILGELPLNTQTGQVWGAVTQGIDYRINTLDSNHNSPTLYTDYLDAGGNGARVMAVPIGDCTNISKPGNTSLPKVGIGCVFLSQKPDSVPGQKYVYAEFIASCNSNGVWNPRNAVLNGPYKIVLFKSPGSSDS